MRYVDDRVATIWLQADARVRGRDPRRRASARGASTGCTSRWSRSRGLPLGEDHPYEVRLDGRARVAASRDRRFPPARSACSTRAGAVDIVFGSCRITRPHEPPYVLRAGEHEAGQGIDALRAYALRVARAGGGGACPDMLLMLGDQIYADQPSPALQEVLAARERPADVPDDELADFCEYALAYGEAWSEPAIRWLLSTVPVTMVFDDHEIHAEWRISQGWLDEMNAEPWFDDHIRAGLMAYWVFQHLGNLSPAELADGRAATTRSARPTTPATLLASRMDTEGRQVGHSRWSFARDLGDARLVVIDSRAGRQVDAGPARARPGRGVGLDPRAGLQAGPPPAARQLGAVPARARPAPRRGLRRGADRRRVGPARRGARREAAAGRRHGPLGVVPAHVPQAGRAARRRRARARRGARRVDRDAVGRRAPLLPGRGRLPARHAARAAACGRRSARRSARSSRRTSSASSRSGTRSSPNASRAGSRAPPACAPLPLDWRVVERARPTPTRSRR